MITPGTPIPWRAGVLAALVVACAAAPIAAAPAAQPAAAAESLLARAARESAAGRPRVALALRDSAVRVYDACACGTPQAHATALGARAFSAVLERQFDGARADLERALALVTGTDTAATRTRARLVGQQASLAFARGQFEDAVRLGEQAAALARTLPAATPELVDALSNSALALSRLSRSAAALEREREALAMAVRVHGADSRAVATEWLRMGEIQLEARDLAGQVESARRALGDINPEVQVQVHDERLTAENATRIIAGYDVVADGSDNFATRYLLNDTCYRLKKTLVSAAILRFDGQVSTYKAWQGAGHPCLRCLFPVAPSEDAVPSCAQAGVLGALAGTLGTLQATEVVKEILGVGRSLSGRLLMYDALAASFDEMTIAKRPDCPTCGVDTGGTS